jgi:hypothetical protein
VLQRPPNAGDAEHALGQPGFVADDEAQTFGEAKRDDGKIVLGQTHRDQSADRAEGGDADHRSRQREQRRHAMHRQQPGDIGAQHVEAEQAEINQSAHAPLQVERKPGKGGDGDHREGRDQIDGHLLTQRVPNSPHGRSNSSVAIRRKLTIMR